jgi:hypothetical protein
MKLSEGALHNWHAEARGLPFGSRQRPVSCTGSPSSRRGSAVALDSLKAAFPCKRRQLHSAQMSADPKELIRAAFEMAKSSGKADWHRMTTAVLKNRLLVMTQGAFKESAFGVHNILEFAELAEDILTIDKTLATAVLTLKDSQTVAPTPSAPYSVEYQRIRPDLWRAVMDYASGYKYVWDAGKGIARAQVADDSAEYLLPTLTSEEDSRWRQDFANGTKDTLEGEIKAKLEAWVEKGLSPRFLPAPLLRRWNEFVQAKIVGRLEEWFKQKHIAPPEKLTVSVSRTPRITKEHDIEEIRDLVINCVRLMTQDELMSMALPPLAVLRAQKGMKK